MITRNASTYRPTRLGSPSARRTRLIRRCSRLSRPSERPTRKRPPCVEPLRLIRRLRSPLSDARAVADGVPATRSRRRLSSRRNRQQTIGVQPSCHNQRRAIRAKPPPNDHHDGDDDVNQKSSTSRLKLPRPKRLARRSGLKENIDARAAVNDAHVSRSINQSVRPSHRSDPDLDTEPIGVSDLAKSQAGHLIRQCRELLFVVPVDDNPAAASRSLRPDPHFNPRAKR